MAKHFYRFISLPQCFLMVILMLTPAFGAVPSRDYESHWAKEVIESAIATGIASGYPDGSFKPDNEITRAEFFALVNNTFKFTDLSESTFTDVAEDVWYAPVISKAKAAGYVNGYPDGSIHPENSISRQEAAVILSQLRNMPSESSNLTYEDAAAIPDWSKQAIIANGEAKIMLGYPDGSFKPADLIKRAEALVAVKNCFDFQTEAETESAEITVLEDPLPPASIPAPAIPSGGGGGGGGGGGVSADPPAKAIEIHAIPNVTVKVGEIKIINAATTPSDAVLTAASATSDVAAASVTGNDIHVSGVRVGSSSITVTGMKSGFDNGIAAFNVSVEADVIGQIYYVSPAGADTNTGLEEVAPFGTFNQAMLMAGPGDMILAKGGTYHEKINITKSGEAGLPITIQNAPGEIAVLDGTGLGPERVEAMVSIINQSNIIISGFEIQNFITDSTANLPMGVNVEGNCANIQILNCKIHDIRNPTGNAYGIRVFGTNGTTAIENIQIIGNEIYNCQLGQSETLVLNGNVSGFKVNYNSVHDNDNIGIDFIGFEGTAPANDLARNGECVGNLVYNISTLSNPTYSGASAGGIYVDGGENVLIDRNIVRNADIGIEIATERGPVTRNITVTNNLITDCLALAGISLGSTSGSSGGGVENLKVYNNTLFNNIHAIQVQNADSSTNLIKNNIFWSGSDITGTLGSNVFSNNIIVDPLFINPTGGDFHLNPGSPAIDAGAEAISPVDLDGNPRVNGIVDAGAYEHQ